MCWNENVSLNTFLFSSFVLALIIYNNAFTKYKIQELNDKWIYLFIASFVFMQLIEFFIWRNINNKFYNNMFSILAVLLIFIQPLASIMILTNIQLRNLLIYTYLLIATPYTIYKFSTNHINSVVSEGGHLIWNFLPFSFIFSIIWLFFYLISFVYEKKWFWVIFGLLTYVITVINYINDLSIGSMWCWTANSCMIYYAIYLLIYLPFLEKMNIC